MTAGKEEIEKFICDEVAMLIGDTGAKVDAATPLIGPNRAVDSADLVVLLLAVEDYANETLGFQWDWTSDSAMSEARSVLRTIGSLAEHLMNQRVA